MVLTAPLCRNKFATSFPFMGYVDPNREAFISCRSSFSLNILSPLSVAPFHLPPHTIYCNPQLTTEANSSLQPQIHGSRGALQLLVSPSPAAWAPPQGLQQGAQGLYPKLTPTRRGAIKHLRVGNREPTDQPQRNPPEKGQNFELFVCA